MSEYWLSKAAAKLRAQIDERWPRRDKASDGWIGDASHQAAVSDHNPCWTCTGDRYGVVRAIDVDTNLDKDDKYAMQRFANQLIACARDGQDGGRLKYVIFDGAIASGTYSARKWRWRPYDGVDPHTNHLHVSFTPAGDFRGASFLLPIFAAPAITQLRKTIQSITDRIEKLKRERAKKSKKLAKLKGI